MEKVKEFNEGVDTLCAELMNGEGYDMVEDFFRTKPIDYDTSVTMWNNLLEEVAKKIRK